VSLPWTPAPALRLPGFPATDPIHTCIKVSVDDPFNSNFANNELERNTTKEARIELKTETRSDWKTRITQNGKPIDAAVFTMKPGDCSKDLVVEMEPPKEARKGDKATFILRALAVVDHRDHHHRDPPLMPRCVTR